VARPAYVRLLTDEHTWLTNELNFFIIVLYFPSLSPCRIVHSSFHSLFFANRRSPPPTEAIAHSDSNARRGCHPPVLRRPSRPPPGRTPTPLPVPPKDVVHRTPMPQSLMTEEPAPRLPPAAPTLSHCRHPMPRHRRRRHPWPPRPGL
jgi:hypothetical protein